MKTFIFIFLIPLLLFAQIEQNNLGNMYYVYKDGKWYTNFNNGINYEVDSKHLIIKMKNNLDIRDFNFLELGISGIKVTRGPFAKNFFEVEISDSLDAFKIGKKLIKSNLFEFVYFTTIGHWEAVTPNDQYFSNQWNLQKIDLPDAWTLEKGDSNIIVAILDSGTDYNHEDLDNNIWANIGYDFFDNDNDPFPYEGDSHGTAVAGVIAAELNNSIGISGIAGGWGENKGVSLMILKIGDQNGPNSAAAAQAIEYAINNGADVINMSWTIAEDPAIETELNFAYDSGVVLVASLRELYI